MYRRPDHVSAAGALLCIFGVVLVIASLVNLANSSSDGPQGDLPSAEAAIGLVGSIIMLVCGIYILQGQNWARWLYAATCAAYLIYAVACHADQLYALVPENVLRAIFLVLIFLPGANPYFRSASRRR
jgi:bacteriorhodopsin